MGFSSIRLYFDRYFGFEYQPVARMLFYEQANNVHAYGNTHTLYGQLIYLPVAFGVAFIPFLGFLIGRIYRLASKNLFFLSMHAWFCAATFMAFAGGGHFTTTRIFPAMLFIWPFLLFAKKRYKFRLGSRDARRHTPARSLELDHKKI